MCVCVCLGPRLHEDEAEVLERETERERERERGRERQRERGRERERDIGRACMRTRRKYLKSWSGIRRSGTICSLLAKTHAH